MMHKSHVQVKAFNIDCYQVDRSKLSALAVSLKKIAFIHKITKNRADGTVSAIRFVVEDAVEGPTVGLCRHVA